MPLIPTYQPPTNDVGCLNNPNIDSILAPPSARPVCMTCNTTAVDDWSYSVLWSTNFTEMTKSMLNNLRWFARRDATLGRLGWYKVCKLGDERSYRWLCTNCFIAHIAQVEQALAIES